MALSESDIDALCDRILHGSQERYLAEMADAIVAHLSQGMAGEWDRAALVQLASEWPSKARQIMAAYAPLIGDEVAAEVGDALASSAASDLAALAAAYGAAAAADGVSAHFRRLADQAAQRVAIIVQRNNLAMEANAEREWYRVVEDAVNAKVLGTKTSDQIVAEAVERLGDSFRVSYQSGRKVPVDTAIRTHIATQASQAGGELTIEAMRSYGCELGITDAHYGARPSHAEWQGLPFGIDGPCEVDGVEYPGIKELTGYGSPSGLKGVNCRHMISPYVPGITELPDREFKAEREKWGMGSDEFYRLTQRQRAWERRIRATKRQIADMERAGLGLDSPSYVQKRLLLGQQQKAVRELCRRHKLTRRLEREKAYGVKTQPRALTGTASATTKRRKAFMDKLSKSSPATSSSDMMAATSLGELKKMLYSKHGVTLIGADGLHFESVRNACAGIDEVLSDFPKARSWVLAKGENLSKGTIMTTDASGTVALNAQVFSREYTDAISDGRHEAGHLLELAMAENAKGETVADFANAKYSKRVLNRALRRMNAETSRKTKLVKAIDSISAYPAYESVRSGNSTTLYAEGLAEAVSAAYNGEAKNKRFVGYVIDELRRELG